jgi:methylenetetrahydrofolate reductase (NADPH)
MTAKSKLAEKLKTGRPVVTAECLPPRGADAEAVKKMAAALPQGLDAVVVADNPEEVRGSATACAAILVGEGREPVLSLVTRDRNRIALESDVLGASLLGVRNFLCLSGDHQAVGVSPQAAGAYDIDSVQFALALKAMVEAGVGFDGRKIDPAPQLFVGVVAHPYLRPMELNLIRLKKKVAAGAAFLLTQAVFDLAGFAEWLEAVRAAGLDKQAAIIASVMPLPSVERAKDMQAKKTYGPVGDDVVQRLAKAADPAAESVAIAAEIAAKLKSMPGVRGIHVLCGGCEALAAGVVKEAGLA